MFNKVCFYLFCVLLVVTLCFYFSQNVLGFNILENFEPTNNILTYTRGLSAPAKLVVVLYNVQQGMLLSVLCAVGCNSMFLFFAKCARL